MVDYENLRAMNNHFKKKKQGGRSFISRVKDQINTNRAERKAEQNRLNQVYKDEFKRASAKAVKKRARKEAYQQFGKTKAERRADTLKAVDNFGTMMSGMGGSQQRSSGKKKKKKRVSSQSDPFDFDLGGFDL